MKNILITTILLTLISCTQEDAQKVESAVTKETYYTSTDALTRFTSWCSRSEIPTSDKATCISNYSTTIEYMINTDNFTESNALNDVFDYYADRIIYNLPARPAQAIDPRSYFNVI